MSHSRDVDTYIYIYIYTSVTLYVKFYILNMKIVE
jgi:hypothetical protein